MANVFLPDSLELLGTWCSHGFGIGQYSVFLNSRPWVHSMFWFDSACMVTRFLFFSWKSCVIIASNCSHFLCFVFPAFGIDDHPVRRTLKSGLTPEEAKALGLISTSEMQVWHPRGGDKKSRSPEAHRLTTLRCGIGLPASSAAPNIPSSDSSIFNKQRKAKPRSQGNRRVGRSSARHWDSDWGSLWVLVGESIWLLLSWCVDVGRRGLSPSDLSREPCLRWLSFCPVLVIVSVWHFVNARNSP